MDLKQRLKDFGCGTEFIEIALTYKPFYNPDLDIETFIEYVEETHAKVEEAEAIKSMENEVVDASKILEEFADGEDI